LSTQRSVGEASRPAQPEQARTSAPALAGLTVLELSRMVSGAYCGKLFAAMGADVIKVEPPEGDAARRVGPFPGNRPDPEASALFLYLNTGKQGITLELRAPEGAAILRALARQADVLIENFAPGAMAGLGLDPADLRALNPRLVTVSITSFGQTGPYRDYRADSMVAQALSGYLYLNGHPRREPLAAGGYQPDYQGALHAFSGALLALLARERSGRGQHVEISIHECMASIHQFTINRFHYVGRIQKRIGNRYQRAHPITIYPCKDGPVSLAVSTQEQYERFLQLIGRADLLDDPRFATTFVCSEHDAAFDACIRPWLMEHTREEIVHACQERRIPAAFVNDVAQVLEDPQLRARGFWQEIAHPVAGSRPYAGLPFQLTATPPRWERACLLGEHNQQVLGGRLGCDPARLADLKARGIL
jgi:crotonobetainyl-CoA:carnitine CoA-transferase CaiB-like acyl-CoA transferase